MDQALAEMSKSGGAMERRRLRQGKANSDSPWRMRGRWEARSTFHRLSIRAADRNPSLLGEEAPHDFSTCALVSVFHHRRWNPIRRRIPF